MSQRILVVDDDTDALEVYKTRLTHAGFEVETAESAEKALGRLKAFDPTLIITDVRMSGMTGLELLDKVRTATEGVDVVVMTGHDDMETAVSAMKSGAFDFLVKPVDPKALQGIAERYFREQDLAADTPAMDDLEGEGALPQGKLVGRDPSMIEIYKTIGVLARNRATVLVRGETGTGKEVIARAVHEHSAHSTEPFIAVNCTALTDTLLESELFGHVKGAFTGAVGSRKGYFELAGKGTIFLDEIGDTSPDFQTKLLRVLQERQFYPVGGEEPRTTQARVIAATHQPMEDLIREGTFREDLYFRLKVVEISVPPLRERPADIEVMANALLGRIREETHRDVRRISDDAVAMLTEYEWPGNVRELENALMRAAIVARGTVIGPDHFLLGDSRPVGDSEDLSMSTAMAQHARRVLGRSGGDRKATAKLLGITQKELDSHCT
ncbi:MAG: sigma-54-dependent Fis family transcriptional regulator [Gemmatimonadales bacterium]|jgi:DNA-binding NtrC family response regulator|nr:sigma-54-dependent Fis family transcriptional regulator [Gemmatimonadales bacterium]MBT3774179.1 sigma-54-dependent Fis family transcriptional regulator [Gemmatimonadales bacterium]MBT3958289.1 sigma-54-dependent Fis family transcriptional regulator [Gemmatimonadales bacterium]MBT4437444.1 sigma-54-dependent Fis family transcriptional regulator [Gemmatimonadales bacterium]MBT4914028.1 sigma-54-dependent Fis family transcriptional regulator [Gemmatimonadales bacterium]